MLKGQDIVVLLALVGRDDAGLSGVAADLVWHVAGVHRSLKRLAEAGLYFPSPHASRRVPTAQAQEFLVHGARYVFPVRPGEPTRGVPTAWAAEPLASRMAPTEEPPPVWPDPLGTVRGVAFEPLHAIAVSGARRNKALAERLALVDAIRGGDARSRGLGADLLADRLRA